MSKKFKLEEINVPMKVVVCPLCKKILVGSAVFTKHYADCQAKKCVCPWCGHRARHTGNMRVHVRNNHPEQLEKFEAIKHTLWWITTICRVFRSYLSDKRHFEFDYVLYSDLDMRTLWDLRPVTTCYLFLYDRLLCNDNWLICWVLFLQQTFLNMTLYKHSMPY